MTKFRPRLFDPVLSPQEGLMQLADAIGEYIALAEIREEKAARETDQNPPEASANANNSKKSL